MTQAGILVRTFYRFTPLAEESVQMLHESLTTRGLELDLLGSILISTEGCNGTISGPPENVNRFFEELRVHFPDLQGQDSFAEASPFGRWKVPIKKQIVQARDPELRPEGNFDGQMPPQEWDEVRSLVRAGQAQMIDVRNRYEVGIGTFPEAIDPDTNTFKEFSDYLDQEVGQSLDPELPTAIFCTGGIRCEKARMDLHQRGFQNVLQLKGGILGYFKHSEEQGFDGECFVFDDRVAVNANLDPSTNYDLCKACGGPKPKDGGHHDCNNGRRAP